MFLEVRNKTPVLGEKMSLVYNTINLGLTNLLVETQK